jgi:nitroreductase
MQLREAILGRRAYRSLDPVEITPGMIGQVMEDVRLSPSCFNNQPWRFTFVFEPAPLAAIKASLTRGNAWAQAASMIVAVASRRDLDCISPAKDYQEREYFLFDTGMATALLLLRLTEMGLVAHPIAGYSEKAAKDAIGMPHDMKLITLIIVGKKSPGVAEALSESQKASEAARPARKPVEDLAFLNAFPPQP